MTEHAAVMPHGTIEEVFPNIFFVTGTMRGEFFGSDWEFGRNMIVIREGETLTVINCVRLDDEGMAALDALGKVEHLMKIGAMHGLDDTFYIERYQPKVWALPGMPLADGVKVDQELSADGPLPVSNASLFVFEQTNLPESILRLDRDGGILIACDSLQNWEVPDAFTNDETIEKMKAAGFFQKANCGVAWMHVNEPKPGDFERLKEISFKHVLCGHGAPLMETGQEDYAATFKRLYDV